MIIADGAHQIAAGFVKVDAHDGAGDGNVEAGIELQSSCATAGGRPICLASGCTQRVFTCMTPRSCEPSKLI